MNHKLKQTIRYLHLAFDSLIGRLFSQEGTLKNISDHPHIPITPKVFSDFGYSKKDHFRFFRTLPLHKNQSPSTCDLKVYMDALVYTFILDNLPPGSRLLEIGGGESRIIKELRTKYEMWNLDKLEGSGFGPKNLIVSEGFNLVQDYIGNHSPNLPASYFDLVFSISTIEHIPQDVATVNNVISDIMRLLKPGGYSLHCIDALLYPDHFFVHPFVSLVHKRQLVDYEKLTFEKLSNEKNVWLLPAFAFYTRWYHLVKKSLHSFGHPFSINILWQK